MTTMNNERNGSDGTTLRTPVDLDATDFDKHRRFLTGLAYRMLGSMAEAEDAVQDAYLRWHRIDKSTITNPRAFLSKTVSRICLDQMRSARARRETYIGPWLPEPVLDAEDFSSGTASEYAADLTVGLMMALERLSPLERAAFLLHDVFDVDFSEVAGLLSRSEDACRQLAARARVNVRAQRPRFTVPPSHGTVIVQTFMTALRSGNVAPLAAILATDAVLRTDGGGKRKAALNPILGRHRILSFLAGVLRKFAEPISDMRMARINGMPGIIIRHLSGDIQTIALEVDGEAIKAIYVVRNPDKLRHVVH